MNRLDTYLKVLHQVGCSTIVTDRDGRVVGNDESIDQLIAFIRKVRNNDGKLMFIGNGGSAGIASHMAIDYSKNGRFPSLAFNDGSALTCLSNDLGYENVFSEQVKLHGRSGDLLVAISSSGASENILNAVRQAEGSGCTVVTMSGFSAGNPLRKTGFLNWYVDSDQYGFVEISHLTLCHAILDIEMGWQPDT